MGRSAPQKVRRVDTLSSCGVIGRYRWVSARARRDRRGAFLGQRMAEIGASYGPILAKLGGTPFAEALTHLEQIRMALDAERD